MNAREKIRIIETEEIKKDLVWEIVKHMFAIYDIDDCYRAGFLQTWLYDRMMRDSLADIILNEQKLYVVELAKKVAADICYDEEPHDFNEFKEALTHYGKLGNFVCTIVLDEFFVENPKEFVNEANDTAALVGYSDSIIIDNKAYVYDDGSKERILVTLNLHIDSHPNYTGRDIKRRIRNRVGYKWETEIQHITTIENLDGSYNVVVLFFAPKSDIGNINQMLLHRFGSTSGRPWHRCHVEGFDID